jgi:hypothetical protein
VCVQSYCKFQEKEAKNQRSVVHSACHSVEHHLTRADAVCSGDKTKPSSMCYYLLPVKRQVSQPMANGAFHKSFRHRVSDIQKR